MDEDGEKSGSVSDGEDNSSKEDETDEMSPKVIDDQA
jgi:hypothetical protein